MTFDVAPTDLVSSLKSGIKTRLGISADQQRIISSSRMLSNDKSLTDYNIGKESTLHLLLTLPVGRLTKQTHKTLSRYSSRPENL